jgi:hypothetical protein
MKMKVPTVVCSAVILLLTRAINAQFSYTRTSPGTWFSGYSSS